MLLEQWQVEVPCLYFDACGLAEDARGIAERVADATTARIASLVAGAGFAARHGLLRTTAQGFV